MRARIATLVILVGVAIRVVTYVLRWGMWQDETLLSLNIGARSPLGLLRPLDYDQAAPIGFLWGEWLVTRVAGMSVWALHALPLLCGIALVILTWVVGRRIVGPDAALIATAMTAVSGLLVSYANLVKPYGSDALVTLVLIGLAAAVLESPQSRAAWVAFGIGAVAAPWFSTPSLFVVGGALLAFLTVPEVPRRYVVATTIAWGAMVAVLYHFVYAAAASNAYLHRYWAYGFLQPNAPQFSERARRAVLAFLQPLAEGTFRSPEVLLGLALVVGGFVVIARRYGRSTLTLLLAPFVAVVAAAFVGVYPIHSRLVLFLAPLLFFAAAAVAAIAPPVVRIALLGLPLVLQRGDLKKVGRPTGNDDTPIMIDALVRRRVSEPVYLVRNAVPGWIYYTTNWPAPDTARLRWIAHLISSDGPAFTAIAHRGHTVHDEGNAFCEVVNGREELIGLGSGEEDLNYGLATTDVDDGWADNEARRIAAAAHPDAWVLANYTDEKELGALRSALDRRGASVTWSGTRPNGAALRVRFPAAAPAPPDSSLCTGPPS